MSAESRKKHFINPIKTKKNAERILLATGLSGLIPLLALITLRVFYYDSFIKITTYEPVAQALTWTTAFIILLLTFLIYRRIIWAAYALLIINLGPFIFDAITDKSIPEMNFFDLAIILLARYSISSINYLRSN